MEWNYLHSIIDMEQSLISMKHYSVFDYKQQVQQDFSKIVLKILFSIGSTVRDFYGARWENHMWIWEIMNWSENLIGNHKSKKLINVYVDKLYKSWFCAIRKMSKQWHWNLQNFQKRLLFIYNEYCT